MEEKLLLPYEKVDRELVSKKKASTSDKFGTDPYKRDIKELFKYGIVNVDKPEGPTSHQTSAYAQKILKVKKGGHSGTLDPKVTGVLPIAFNRATRIVQALLPAGKEYICLMHLHKDVSDKQLADVMKKFTGRITQTPPIKSAVVRKARKRTIYYMKLLDRIGQDVLFIVGSQGGTYIRKLVHDMGEMLGVGAHMAQLRRTRAGPFREDTLFSLQDVSDAMYYLEKGDETFIRKVVQPMEAAVVHLPKIFVLDSTVSSLCHGADLKLPGVAKYETNIVADELVAIMTLKGELVALGDALIKSSEMENKSGMCIKVRKVFMEAGVYPKPQD